MLAPTIKWGVWALMPLLLLGACGGCREEKGPASREGGADLSEILTGEETSAAGRAQGGNACELIEEAEIAESVGNPVLEGQAMGALHCMWDTAEIDDTGVSLTAFVKQKGARKMSEVCTEIRESGEAIGPSTQDVSGVGDQAWWTFAETPALNSGQLWACSGDAVVGLSLAGSLEESAMLAAAQELVSRAFGRV